MVSDQRSLVICLVVLAMDSINNTRWKNLKKKNLANINCSYYNLVSTIDWLCGVLEQVVSEFALLSISQEMDFLGYLSLMFIRYRKKSLFC